MTFLVHAVGSPFWGSFLGSVLSSVLGSGPDRTGQQGANRVHRSGFPTRVELATYAAERGNEVKAACKGRRARRSPHPARLELAVPREAPAAIGGCDLTPAAIDGSMDDHDPEEVLSP